LGFLFQQGHNFSELAAPSIALLTWAICYST
jgi:hypothetical protein